MVELLDPSEPRDDLVVEAHGLTKHYGNLKALDEVDLEIPKGSIFGIIGPNGAGKSTAFLILATLLTPTSGWARVCGFSPVAEPEEVRRRMGYMPDVMGVYENLTVKEYLEFHAATYHIDRSEWPSLVDGLLELVDLDVKRETIVDDLSRGMKQRLSLARALVHDPELLILDEPASGLDPRARIELRELLLQLQSMGKSIVISSHILAELQQMCDAIAVIEAGQLLASGPPGRILAQLGVGRSVRVRFGDGIVEEFPVAGDDEQQALLRKLIVDDDRAVLEFTTVDKNLEDLFLQITQGIVQ
ncbi:MAG: ABC transporter ATP-binding protein [Acidimicrobiia bacterium]|nr:ABC transporter ATP-binding protein [Acidimicrobiia bacterium]